MVKIKLLKLFFNKEVKQSCGLLFIIISVVKNLQVGKNHFNVWIMGLGYTGLMQ